MKLDRAPPGQAAKIINPTLYSTGRFEIEAIRNANAGKRTICKTNPQINLLGLWNILFRCLSSIDEPTLIIIRNKVTERRMLRSCMNSR